LPAALNSLALEVTAIVGDGFIRFKVLETMLIEFYNIIFKIIINTKCKILIKKKY
jgi:hypothetical protein